MFNIADAPYDVTPLTSPSSPLPLPPLHSLPPPPPPPFLDVEAAHQLSHSSLPVLKKVLTPSDFVADLVVIKADGNCCFHLCGVLLRLLHAPKELKNGIAACHDSDTNAARQVILKRCGDWVKYAEEFVRDAGDEQTTLECFLLSTLMQLPETYEPRVSGLSVGTDRLGLLNDFGAFAAEQVADSGDHNAKSAQGHVCGGVQQIGDGLLARRFSVRRAVSQDSRGVRDTELRQAALRFGSDSSRQQVVSGVHEGTDVGLCAAAHLGVREISRSSAR